MGESNPLFRAGTDSLCDKSAVLGDRIKWTVCITKIVRVFKFLLKWDNINGHFKRT